MIQGISHITFIVSNLEKSANFFKSIFDANEVYDSGEKTSISRTKFLLVNGLWIALIHGESLSEKTYNHVAFHIKDEDLDKYKLRIERLGLEIKESRSRVAGEGNSLYFYDFDNHLFELHTGTLAERLNVIKTCEKSLNM